MEFEGSRTRENLQVALAGESQNLTILRQLKKHSKAVSREAAAPFEEAMNQSKDLARQWFEVLNDGPVNGSRSSMTDPSMAPWPVCMKLRNVQMTSGLPCIMSLPPLPEKKALSSWPDSLQRPRPGTKTWLQGMPAGWTRPTGSLMEMEPKADDIPVAGCVQAGSLLFSCPATGKSGSSPMDFCPASCLPGNIQAKYQTPVTPTVHLSFCP